MTRDPCPRCTDGTETKHTVKPPFNYPNVQSQPQVVGQYAGETGTVYVVRINCRVCGGRGTVMGVAA